MNKTYETDLNSFNESQVKQIEEIFRYAAIGKSLIKADYRDSDFEKILVNDIIYVIGANFLGCAFIGKFGLDKAKHIDDAAQWGVLLWKKEGKYENNSFCHHIRYLNSVNGYQAVHDFLQDIIDEYEQRYKQQIDMLSKKIIYRDMLDKVRNMNKDTNVRKDYLESIIKYSGIWSIEDEE